MIESVEEIKREISSIHWNDYYTAYGNAAKENVFKINIKKENIFKINIKKKYHATVESALLDLFSDNTDIAMNATHVLWCSLCHQHAFISSAALPAYNFLFLALQYVDESIKIEILDILYGFAMLTDKNASNWEYELRMKLEKDYCYYEQLSLSDNEEISEFAKNIITELNI